MSEFVCVRYEGSFEPVVEVIGEKFRLLPDGRRYSPTKFILKHRWPYMRIYAIHDEDGPTGELFVRSGDGEDCFLTAEHKIILREAENLSCESICGKKKKVLIIEGGGAFGILPAFFLSLVQRYDQRWLESIDCLSGCSIGGILALAYASGKTPEFVFDIFREKMPQCFDKRFIARINPLANPTYTLEGIDGVLKEVFGDDTLKDCHSYYPNLSVFVPALNLTKNSYKVFDNIEGKDDAILLRDIAGFTSAAPSYYEGRDFNGQCMVDGGMIEVAPLVTTITGLQGKKRISFKDMDVLMIGCGHRVDSKRFTTKSYNGLSLLGIATDLLAPYVTLSNNLATLYWGNNLGLNSFRYFNPVDVEGGMDDVDAMKKALDKADQYSEEFLDMWDEWIRK